MWKTCDVMRSILYIDVFASMFHPYKHPYMDPTNRVIRSMLSDNAAKRSLLLVICVFVCCLYFWLREGTGVSSLHFFRPNTESLYKNKMNQDLTDSGEETITPECELRHRRVDGSPKRKTTSPNDNFEHLYAIATVRNDSQERGRLALEIGDGIVTITQTDGLGGVYEGENERTGKRGIFLENWVEFHQGQLPTQTNTDVQGTPTNQQVRPENANPEAKQILVCIAAGLVILALACYYIINPYITGSRQRSPVNISELKSAFKAQDPNMWDTLQAGLLPSKTEATKTFLFVHAKDSPTVECLIKKLSDNYCQVYRASEMHLDESVVYTVKESLKKQKCMVIYDLENLQEDGIALLKGFCDAYTPIVRDAEFYFALDTEDPPVDAEVARVARQKLETMWSKKYSHDEFGGTVTRLIQNVLRVTGEEKLPC